MSGQPPAPEKVSPGAKAVFILLAGALSMFFAEVLSGSSVLWFVTPWAWLVTFWLYLAHTVLFVNLALIFKRTSLTALYLWGILFGLYESWITKVAWAGHAGSTAPAHVFLGFAVVELPLIVFLWHPVFSFILPVLSFETLSGKSRILSGHRRLLAKTRYSWILALIIVFIGALFLSFNARGNAPAVVITIMGSVALIGALYWIASKWFGGQFSIESLRLGKKGMAVLIVYLALLYTVAFFAILPEKIAPPLTILLTLGVYAAIILLLCLKKPDGAVAAETGVEKRSFGLRDIGMMLAVLTILGALFSLVTPADYLLVTAVYLALAFLAPALLLLAVAGIAKAARKGSAPNVP